MTWRVTPELFRGLAGIDFAAAGIPDEAAYVAAYCRRTGRDRAIHVFSPRVVISKTWTPGSSPGGEEFPWVSIGSDCASSSQPLVGARSGRGAIACLRR